MDANERDTISDLALYHVKPHKPSEEQICPRHAFPQKIAASGTFYIWYSTAQSTTSKPSQCGAQPAYICRRAWMRFPHAAQMAKCDDFAQQPVSKIAMQSCSTTQQGPDSLSSCNNQQAPGSPAAAGIRMHCCSGLPQAPEAHRMGCMHNWSTLQQSSAGAAKLQRPTGMHLH